MLELCIARHFHLKNFISQSDELLTSLALDFTVIVILHLDIFFQVGIKS